MMVLNGTKIIVCCPFSSGFHSQWLSGFAEDFYWRASKFDPIYLFSSMTNIKQVQRSDSSSIKLLVHTTFHTV